MNSTITSTGVDSPALTVPIFGGQGSRSLFSDRSITLASQDAQTHTGAVLLSECYRAFLAELDSLEAEERRSLGFGVTDFLRSDSLVKVPSELQNNPIIHGTTLCLFQLLRYLGHVDASCGSFEDAAKDVLESAGFCFGVLPAAVVSASKTSLDFITYGVEAFRLAFWIGMRCMAFAKSLAVGPEDVTSDHSWSLVLVGVGKEEALKKLQDFHKEVCSPVRFSDGYLTDSFCRTPHLDYTLLPSVAATASPFLAQHQSWLGSKTAMCLPRVQHGSLISTYSFTEVQPWRKLCSRFSWTSPEGPSASPRLLNCMLPSDPPLTVPPSHTPVFMAGHLSTRL